MTPPETTRFRHGIGVAHVFGWADVQADGSYVLPPFLGPRRRFRPEQIAALREAGLDFVRLAVDPGPFIALKGANLAQAEQALNEVVHATLAGGLGVIVDIHPSDMHPSYTSAALTQGVGSPSFGAYTAFVTRIASQLSRLFDRLRAERTMPRLALELLNEPEVPPAEWQPMLEAAYAAARLGGSSLPLVLGGGLQNAPEALTAIDTGPFRADPAVIYTFHDYQPWQFTHQGVAGNPAFVLSHIPYPADADAIGTAEEASRRRIEMLRSPSKAELAPEKDVRAAQHADGLGMVRSYRNVGFNRTTMMNTFERISAWCDEQALPRGRIMLGEFGVHLTPYQSTPAGAASRERWIRDMREIAEANGFAWSAWVYAGAGGFALSENERGPELDPLVARALGLLRHDTSER